jgi:hypothetical protein
LVCKESGIIFDDVLNCVTDIFQEVKKWLK